MSIPSIPRSVVPLELRHVTTSTGPAPARVVARPVQGPAVPPAGPDGGPAPGGDGPVLVSLKQSLAAAGFSAAGATTSPDDTQAAMHGFTNAFFDSVQAQRQADAAAGQPVGMRGAIHQLADQAAAGNAPADLQAAFDTLQQTQPADSPARQATLSQVLAGMAATAPDDAMPIGSLVDASA
jgi:hypothetical protein